MYAKGMHDGGGDPGSVSDGTVCWKWGSVEKCVLEHRRLGGYAALALRCCDECRCCARCPDIVNASQVSAGGVLVSSFQTARL
jgi:hypothetical protein